MAFQTLQDFTAILYIYEKPLDKSCFFLYHNEYIEKRLSRNQYPSNRVSESCWLV